MGIITNVKDSLIRILRAYAPSIKHYSRLTPEKLENPQLPYAYFITGEGSYEAYAEGLKIIKRTIILQIAVKPAIENVEYDEKYIDDLLEEVQDVLLGLSHIEVQGVQNITIATDSGIVPIEGFNREFVGFQFPIEIEIIKSFTRIKGE